MLSRRTRRTAMLAAAVGIFAAAPAAAKPIAYSGTTSGGDQITFKRVGGAVKKVRALIPTSCVASTGWATSFGGGELFEPPGRLALGGEVRRSALQEPIMHYNDVTKNYRFTARKRRNGTISGRLHLNFSYQAVHYGSDWMLIAYICQGDATFKAKPVRRG